MAAPAPISHSWSTYLRICNFTDKEDWKLIVPFDDLMMFDTTDWHGNHYSLPDHNYAWLDVVADEFRCRTHSVVPLTIFEVGLDSDQGTTFDIHFKWIEEKKICRPSFGDTDVAYQPVNYVTAGSRLMIDDEKKHTESIILSVCTPHEWLERADGEFGASCPYQKAHNIDWYDYPLWTL
eukprot:Clim_evm1s244 gene=Clim_evmTU1s244